LRAKSVEISFTPVDNQRLANLCGALDENLRSIESALDISISRRGECFRLSGQPERTAQGVQALERLYGQAGEHVSPDDIQLGLVEVRQQMPVAEAAEVAPLLPRKGDLRGRTPRQILYLQHIQTHDITFAIGPAGTGKTYLAVACAVDALERDRVKRIVLVRPAVEAGERLGFLPGPISGIPARRKYFCAMISEATWLQSSGTVTLRLVLALLPSEFLSSELRSSKTNPSYG
jgi:phosphate starvation-inducible PhoH-like protein